MTFRPKFFALACSLALAACGCAAAPTADGDTADVAADALDADAAKDPVLVANAKTFFRALVEENTNRDQARIPYAKLPSKLAREVAQNNPDPDAEWAAEAYRTKVKDGAGHDATVFGVMDGIDDEGEDITVYTSRGRQIAEGDDYRGFVWN